MSTKVDVGQPWVPEPNNNEIPFAKIKVHQQLQSQPFMTLFLTKYLKYFTK